MSHISALHELMATRVWLASPALVHATRDMFINNVALRTPIEEVLGKARAERILPSLVSAGGFSLHLATVPAASPAGSTTVPAASPAGSTTVTEGSPEDAKCYCTIDTSVKDPYTGEHTPAFVHVMEVCGGILRNSGACSDGSMDQRDELIRATDDGALAHVIVVNSGGGQASSLLDYEDGINYCRDHGQPVVVFVRGMACSCAYGLSAMSDYIFASSRADIVGCIGAMGAGFTSKDGDTDAVTQETYRELYATKSVNKNRLHRDIAKGDYEKWQASLDECEEKFNAIVSQYRPAVEDSQKDGLDFPAADVVGTLVDEIGDFTAAYEKALSLAEDATLAARQQGTKAE